MAQALFVTTKDIATFTALNGNVDVDKFMQFIKISQDIHIQNYLGTDLYNKINDDIVSSSLAGDYLTLVNDYIKPMVIHWAMVEYLPFSAYTIANKGVYKHSSENSESVEKNEVDFLINKERSIAKNYTQRFVDFMCFNSNDYPEFNTNSNGDVYPDKEVNFTNWFL
jgi:phytoene dehydrogenase-like protein